MKRPKAEGRKPKEVRSPIAESAGAGQPAGSMDPGDGWPAESAEGLLVLREAATPPPQRDLMTRTTCFAEAIVRFAKTMPQTPVTNRLVDQLVGAGTSVAANYCEADDAVSGRDYRNKIGTCRKESKETMLFLRLAAVADERLAPEARRLWREAKELNLIFGAIWRKGQ